MQSVEVKQSNLISLRLSLYQQNGAARFEPAVAESVLKDYECEADAPFEYLAAMKRLLLRTEPGFKS